MVVVREGESEGDPEGASARPEAEPGAGLGVGRSAGTSGAAQVPQKRDESGFAALHLGQSNVLAFSPLA